MIDAQSVHWQNRAHFYGSAAQAMRQILIDRARACKFAKRGGGVRHVALDETAAITQERAPDLVALDDALRELARLDRS